VLSLFSPLGVPSAAYTATLIPNLDALGSARGTHAHQGASAVVSMLDPETEYKRLDAILQDLAVFDHALAEFRRKIR
jgi:hypothetical protein